MRQGIFLVVVLFFLVQNQQPSILYSIDTKSALIHTPTPQPKAGQPLAETPPPVSFLIPQASQSFQTFNNCGPATLSMALSYFGVNITQHTLRDEMRPFNNPLGGLDDKSIFAPEFVHYAKKQGLQSFHRPNGDINIIKKFISNGIPVVVRTWLRPNEDIGHFRVVRGYDSAKQSILQDDSYEGPNREYDYQTFLGMWQPFNYGYMLVYPREKQEIVNSILAEEIDEQVAWRNSIKRAESELSAKQNLYSSYSLFNLSVAYYYLGDFQKSVEYFEKVQYNLPPRMLWYQIEPIRAYGKIGNHEKVFQLTSSILNSGNLAYSELYQLRGESFKAQGLTGQADIEFGKALYYNKNFGEIKPVLGYE